MSILRLIFTMQQKGKTQQQIDEVVDRMYPSYSAVDNSSDCPYSYEWFIDPRVADNKVSAAEKKLLKILKKWKVKVVPEVSMKGIKLPTGGYARFDFLIQMGYPFVLVEYDGKQAHSTKEQISRDNLKSAWCSDQGIRLVRYNRKHYYNLEDHITELMSEYGIKRK